jgi:3-oxoacyl-(acyl-carrier-protein) synthase
LIKQHFGFYHQPLVISNACISGLLAILTAKRLIASGQYDHAVVAGADIISKFVLSGFQSFQAISPNPANLLIKNGRESLWEKVPQQCSFHVIKKT